MLIPMTNDHIIETTDTGNSCAVFVRSGARSNDRRQENRFAGTAEFGTTAADVVAAAKFLCPEVYGR